MTTSEALIELENVRYRYRGGEKPALEGIDLKISPGEFVVVIGPSRAGKSTLCFTINGLIPLFLRGSMKGDVCVAGMDTRKCRVADLSRAVAMVFQDFESQLFSTSAAIDVAFGPENFGLPQPEIARRVDAAFEMVGLQGFQKREPASLSGGEKQRLAIAAALAMGSQILVMDEPTTDLDPIGKQSIFKVANQLRQAENHTILFVEHETEETTSASRVIMLVDGRIVLDGPPHQVLNQVETLRSNGVMPVGVADLVHELGVPGEPVEVDECYDLLKQGGWQISQPEYDQLVVEDKAHVQKYGPPVFEVKDLSYSYGPDNLALDKINLNVREGEFLAIIGQNGSGKTTLAKHFNGLLKPTQGEVRVYGQDSRKMGLFDLSKITGYVFQNPDHQIFAETIGDEVAFGPKNLGMSEKDIKESVLEALASVDLQGREEDDPFLLTKGERQRVAVASVLATRPKVILMDEPTTGLDYKEQMGIMNLLKRLNEEGHTIIIISHTMWVVSHYAHRGVVMSRGQVVMDGTIREVFAREEELTSLHLRPPQIVRLSNRFGHTLLSVDEARRCFTSLKAGDHV